MSAEAVLTEFLAGAFGSVTTKIVIFPLETVRVILSVRSSAALQQLSLQSSFNGLPLACLDTALYNGANFAGYLYLKQRWVGAMPPLLALLAGMLAGSLASFVAMPLNVITTMRQASNASTKPLSASQATAVILRSDGVPGLWRGFPAAIYKNIDPAITFVVFDWLRALAIRVWTLQPTPLSTFCFGLLAKAVAIVASYPLTLAQAKIHAMDKSKAKAKAKEKEKDAYSSVSDVWRQVLATRGWQALYSGLWVTLCGECLKSALKFTLKDQFQSRAMSVTTLLT